MSLVRDYLKKTEILKKEYGSKSIVLIQIGAFYEMYGVRDPETGTITGSDIQEFANYCELAVSKKNICVGQKDVVMAGFRDYMLEKYLKKLQMIGYTTAVWSQDEKAAGSTRSLTGIFSPGTYFTNETTQLTNNTMCIWLEKIQKEMVVGIANIDIYTGKSFLFEYQQEYATTPDAYDELERYISIYTPSEVIVIHNLTPHIVDDILHFIDIKTDCRHIIDKTDLKNAHYKKITNCEKQVYQSEVMQKFFPELNMDNHPSLYQYPIGAQTYCYLLDFIFQHNPDLTRMIQPPQFENCSTRLILANHSLKQLNIIDSELSGCVGRSSSVVSFLNQCKTPMGKRKFNYTLLHPLTDGKELQKEYDFCEHLLCMNNGDDIRELLGEMKDLEKLTRKIVMKRITPCECFHMVHSLKAVQEIYKKIHLDGPSSSYFFNNISNEINNYCTLIYKIVTEILVLEECKSITTLEFDENFIKPGFNVEHDLTVENWYDSYDKLVGIQTFFNEKVAAFEKGKTPKNDYIKIHSTEKSGNSIICTKRRATILKNQLKTIGIVKVPYYSTYSKTTKELELNINEIEMNQSTGTNMVITTPLIKKICSTILSSKQIMVDSVKRLYKNLTLKLFDHLNKLDEIVRFTALVDFTYTKAEIAFKFNLCKPYIKSSQKSFVDVKGLRHILIESLLQNELYVTNDIELNNEQLGVLLYGTNAVGKSSFIKALGISIIMAQAGFYVPCVEFNYSPYKHIFTRILGNDNLFKGLSSFAVEMIELKTILSMATENSLILGDELCSGTESNSAISIFVSGIQHLYKEKSNFIFATHFHEIVDFEEIRDMSYLALKHMSVFYNKEKDKLVYDRKLRDGPGESMYGLEVCKSLHLPSEFLENAHTLRNKYNDKTSSILEWKQSHYNSKKLRGLCELCKEEFSTEVHHIEHQKDAQDNGYIGSFHKNHKANLLSLCEKCHLKQHQNITIKSV